MFTLRWVRDEAREGRPGGGHALLVTPNDGTVGTMMLAMSILGGAEMELLANCPVRVLRVDRGDELNGVALDLHDETRRNELERMVHSLLG